MTEKTTQATSEKFRIDKWLFAARFFKTRSLAAEAIERGRVQLNGIRAKPAKTLTEGDELDIRIGPYHYQITVVALSNKRGPATEAQKLYQETDESRRARAILAEKLKAQPHFEGKGRPTKRTRRDLERFMSGE
jgi:ribosome-associated heat shock protein Hsp15